MSAATVPEEVNFCFPIRSLSSDRVKLIPFSVSIHAATYFAYTAPHPELYTHIPLGPFSSEQDFVEQYIHGVVRPNPGMILYAVIDKTSPCPEKNEEGALAGIIAYMNTSPVHLSTEIGYVITFPPFQRTHVTSNAVGLLLQYALEPLSKGGLGLRRVQWQTSSMNSSSVRVAERMGFNMEGVLKWDRVYHGGKANGKTPNGREMPRGGNEDDPGRDTVLLSHCWDDWEQGGRERVQAAIDR